MSGPYMRLVWTLIESTLDDFLSTCRLIIHECYLQNCVLPTNEVRRIKNEIFLLLCRIGQIYHVKQKTHHQTKVFLN